MIRLTSVSMSFQGDDVGADRFVLREVDLHVAEGEFVCLLGPSGCGKSTLLNLVAGFLLPTSGEARFGGRSIAEPGPDRGVVFQDPTLFPWLTVRQNVEFGLASAGLPREQRRARGQAALALVGLEGCEYKYPYALSGGMRQRAALARVLVLTPRALLMDEPFGALDTNTRERLQDELLRIWQAQRRTVLFVTHNVEEAAYLADRVVVMGPAPRSIRSELLVGVSRPRDRLSAGMRDVVYELRARLDEMPCCV